MSEAFVGGASDAAAERIIGILAKRIELSDAWSKIDDKAKSEIKNELADIIYEFLY